MSTHESVQAVAVLLGLVLAGCGGEGQDGNRSKTDGEVTDVSEVTGPAADSEVETVAGLAADLDALFGVDHVQEVVLELDASDWATLRRETRSMFDVLAGDCMAGPAVSPFNWYEANLWIDGNRYPTVSVRKKGFIGSLSTAKPGMKMEFDDLPGTENRRIHGMERLLLNNTPQDATMLRTCLAYDYFTRAGIPAPRCGFSHVTVNDEDLGIYATVQAVDEHFLDEHFGTSEVALFEGTLSDLRDGWTATYDPDSEVADHALIEPLVDAVETGDFDTIAAVIDVDAFVRFWVAEAMVGHWDGYGWNNNNYFLAFRPDDGRAVFLPWGPDAALASWSPGGGLDWIPLNSTLTRALAETSEGQALYRAELERQLTEVWDAGDMPGRIDDMAATIWAWHNASSAVADLHAIADYHNGSMWGGLGSSFPSITWPMREPLCMDAVGTISYSFEGEWGSLGGSGSPGACSGEFTWAGAVYPMPEGPLYTGIQDGIGYVACFSMHGPSTGAQVAPYIYLPPDELTAGELYTDFMVRRALLYYNDWSMGDTWSTASWVEGTLVLDEAEPDGMVRGSYEGTLWLPAW